MPCFNTCFRLEGKIAPLSCHSLIRYWMSNMASDAKVRFSSKVEYRAVIQYLYLKGKTGQEIHCELTNVYGSSAPSYAQVEFWVGESKRSRTSLEDETRSGRPSDATDEEMCNKVRDLVYSDRRIKVEEIANALHISHGSVSTTLPDRLGMHKLTARWVQKSLSDEQMATRASVCSGLLKRFRSKKNDLLSRLVTVDETWVHYYEPENKAQSHQSVGPGSPRPKKLKTQPSAGKVMATVFWDAQGVIMLDFLAKKSTIIVAYYANLLDQLRTVIRKKRRDKLSKGILLQQDNARVHTCKIAMDAVERNGYEPIPQPRLFSGLSSRWLFPIPKLENGYPWTSFPIQRRSRGGSWGVGQRQGPWLLQFWADGTGTPLVQVHHSRGNYIENEKFNLTQK